MREQEYEHLARIIRKHIEDGATQLENLALRAEVNALIKYGGMNPQPEALSSWDIMKHLALAVLNAWPDPYTLDTFSQIEQKLLPLKGVREALKTEDLSEWVAVTPQARIVEPRLPLKTFKTALWETILKSHA